MSAPLFPFVDIAAQVSLREPSPTIWLIPALPLFGAMMNLAFGAALQRRGQTRAVSAIAILSVAASFFVTLVSTGKLISLEPHARAIHQILWPLLSIFPIRADVAFAFDPLSAVLCLVITGIGTLIHVYSTVYMAGDRGYWRFFFALNLFVFAMLILVLADNLVLLFIGWEGVGVCSYILIGFWYEDRAKAQAALKAFVVNRVGDAAFIVGLLLLFWSLGGRWFLHEPVANVGHEARWHLVDPSYEPDSARGIVYLPNVKPDERHRPSLRFDLLRAELAEMDIGAREDLEARSWHGIPLLALIGLLIFLGCTAKSAQIPLYVWLPDAMAGPTPVSALIHAATMVTAGVYLVARLSFLFALSPLVMTVIATVGVATALLAALMAVVQTDLKRVLAYSTVSQLGLMFMGAGAGAFGAAIFHLVTHAFFKACLFLAAGSVILALHHEQDLRKMGGLGKALPFTRAAYFYACLAISGIPLASGFFSKDELLFGAFTAGKNVLPGFGPLLWAGGLLTALLTSFYMWRSYYLTFAGEFRGEHLPRQERFGIIPVVLLTLAAGAGVTIVLGFWKPLGELLQRDSLRHPLMERWLEPSLQPVTDWVSERITHVTTAAEWATIAASLAVALLGWGAAWALYRPAPLLSPARIPIALGPLYRTATRLFYVDAIYAAVIVKPTQLLARAFAAFDRSAIDGAVHAVSWSARALSRAEDAFDRLFVDGLVNGVGGALLSMGRALRHGQTGRLQNYVYVAIVGALLVIGLNLLLRR